MGRAHKLVLMYFAKRRPMARLAISLALNIIEC